MNLGSGTFRSLRHRNFRMWAVGAFVSNVGTWMQRVAQDWIVLNDLSAQSGTAVGTVMALQYGPLLLLLPVTGYAADHFDRRKLLLVTQALMGGLALGLGLLTVTGVVRLWHVYAFAFALGCVSAFDAPARQTFVAELVGPEDLANAVALNSTSFNAARLIGPAVAGVLAGVVGSGWVFLLNAASFVAVIGSLASLRVDELVRDPARGGSGKGKKRGGIVEGFSYAWGRPDLRLLFFMLFLVGTFGLNFPIFISKMAVGVFHRSAAGFGILTSMMAVGSVSGALLAAGQARPRVARLVLGAAFFGCGLAVAAFAPTFALFGIALVAVGAASQTFTTTTNGAVQLSTEPLMRGRVMALFLAIAVGGTPLGAPIVGYVADRFGPRWSIGVGAAAGFLAALAGLAHLAKYAGTPAAGRDLQEIAPPTSPTRP